jgi:hypothetical protein
MVSEFDQFSAVGRTNRSVMQDGERQSLKNSETCGPEAAEYSYAYYEPGPSSSHAKSSANPRSSKHTYVTHYGTEENIYEEISEVAAKCSRLAEDHHRHSHQSQLSLTQSVLEEEVRRVQSRHRRVLGELNLAVEAMLMPPPPPKDEDTPNETKDSGPPFLLEDLLLSVGPTDELLSPASCSIGDHDSGFSGSSGTSYGFSGSSGASYNTSVHSGSSLRRHTCEKGFPRTSCGGVSTAPIYSPLLLRRVVKSGAACVKFNQTRDSTSGCEVQLQSRHRGLFGRKGWIRLPGFGSSQPDKGRSRPLTVVAVY